MEVLPKPWSDFWNEWGIRVTVLISLLLQIILIMFSSWRRRNPSKSFALLIWSVYLLADWVAVLALGLLCTSQTMSACNNNNNHMATDNDKIKKASLFINSKLLAFWAPFILLHLGGPDNITAFAMEDNELWPRHLLGLLFQVGSAAYVFLLSIPENPLFVPTLLMFLAGIIKYAERTYALCLGSLDGFRSCVLKRRALGPDYAKLIEEYAYKEESGVSTRVELIEEPEITEENSNEVDKEAKETENLQEAHKFFGKFKGLIVGLTFTFHELRESRTSFLKKTAQNAFRVVEFELGFVHEVLFTKAVVVHEPYGYILRAMCSSSIVAAFLSFFFLSKKHHFSKLDIAITYTLLGGAICLDAIALVMLVLSDWTVARLKNSPISCDAFSEFILRISPRNRWSASITQYNLIDCCIPPKEDYLARIMDRPTLFGRVDEMLCIGKMLRWTGFGTKLIDELQYSRIENVTCDLKEYIYEQLKKKTKRGDYLERTISNIPIVDDYLLKFGQFGEEVDFDEILLAWHIATDLCYYEEIPKEEIPKDAAVTVKASTYRKICKLISDYLLYILVLQPSMMLSAGGIGKLRYRDTCTEVKRFLCRIAEANANNNSTVCSSKRKLKEKYSDELKRLFYKYLALSFSEVHLEDERSISVLYDGYALAEKLKTMEKEGNRWKIICEMWIEMLIYAARQCPEIAHAQRLCKGGELLTFVWFLMTHLDSGGRHSRFKLVQDK